MVLQHPMPLTEREWSSLMIKLNTPATEKQKKMMQEAEENGKRIETYI